VLVAQSAQCVVRPVALSATDTELALRDVSRQNYPATSRVGSECRVQGCSCSGSLRIELRVPNSRRRSDTDRLSIGPEALKTALAALPSASSKHPLLALPAPRMLSQSPIPLASAQAAILLKATQPSKREEEFMGDETPV
jgi:hypothetical protein